MTGHRHILCYALSLAIGITLQVVFSPLQAQEAPVIKGQVEKLAEPVSDKLQGQVIDAQTGLPIPDAYVSVPDLGFSMKTSKDGTYQIPRYVGKHPVIMSIEKPGYAPFSLSITEQAPPYFAIRLQKQAEFLILDNQLRHLGDGSFSAASVSAGQFRKPPDGPGIRIQFSVEGLHISSNPYVQIGSIIGLDTPLSHFLSKTQIDASASPLLVKLNGALIAQIHVNGDNQKVQIPSGRLFKTGLNVLEIEAGYHFPEPGRLDYDDMELMHIVFYP